MTSLWNVYKGGNWGEWQGWWLWPSQAASCLLLSWQHQWPHVWGWPKLPLQASQASLRWAFVAPFYCRDVGRIRILPNQFLLGHLPWDPEEMPANKLDPRCVWYASLFLKQNVNSTNSNWVIFWMFVCEWKFLFCPSVTNAIKFLKAPDAFAIQR